MALNANQNFIIQAWYSRDQICTVTTFYLLWYVDISNDRSRITVYKTWTFLSLATIRSHSHWEQGIFQTTVFSVTVQWKILHWRSVVWVSIVPSISLNSIIYNIAIHNISVKSASKMIKFIIFKYTTFSIHGSQSICT